MRRPVRDGGIISIRRFSFHSLEAGAVADNFMHTDLNGGRETGFLRAARQLEFTDRSR